MFLMCLGMEYYVVEVRTLMYGSCTYTYKLFLYKISTTIVVIYVIRV